MNFLGKIERKFRERTNPYFAPFRRKALTRTDFTIISNNCWAGSAYRFYGLPYQTPTVGLYFFANDYIKFVYDLRHYMSAPLEFITSAESSHTETLQRRGETNNVLARLDDIEVVFLHYHNEQEAKEKWERRRQRINWDNIFIKFSEMNECTTEDLLKFDSLDFPNKICLTSTRMPDLKSSVYFPQGGIANGQIVDDTIQFRRGVHLTKWLNSTAAAYEL